MAPTSARDASRPTTTTHKPAARPHLNTMTTVNTLQGCVDALRNSSRLLDSSIQILDSGVHDFPRMKKVLETTRHFELISESKLFHAQQSLEAEIGPEVEHLLKRVEQHLAKLERREKGLVAKSELQEQRLRQRSAGRGQLGEEEKRRRERREEFSRLQNRGKRLEHTLERLQMQVRHKERQARMSLAYGGR